MKSIGKMEVELNTKTLNFDLDDDEYVLVDKTREFKKRSVVRAICIDENNDFLFCHITRDDKFGCFEHLETSGGGIEEGESDDAALKRELQEELGVEIEILAYLGEVRNKYNLLYTTTYNRYYLVRKIGECENHLTELEKNNLHLAKIKLTFDEVENFYKDMQKHRLGRLLYKKEWPFIELAKKIMDVS